MKNLMERWGTLPPRGWPGPQELTRAYPPGIVGYQELLRSLAQESNAAVMKQSAVKRTRAVAANPRGPSPLCLGANASRFAAAAHRPRPCASRNGGYNAHREKHRSNRIVARSRRGQRDGAPSAARPSPARAHLRHEIILKGRTVNSPRHGPGARLSICGRQAPRRGHGRTVAARRHGAAVRGVAIRQIGATLSGPHPRVPWRA